MRAKLNRSIDKDGIKLNTRDSRDIQDLCKDIAGEVRNRFGEGSFIRVYWEQQLDYHTHAKKQGMRWHPLIVHFALNLKYLSSNAYKAVSGFISLPSERTLRDYTHWTEFTSGSSAAVIERMKDMDFDKLTPPENKVALSMDEMKVRKGLVFNKYTGSLMGFVDLGKVNS